MELRQEQHGSTGHQQHVDAHEEAMHVIDRQGVDQHVVGGEPPAFDERPGVGRQVAMGQHRSLRASRGARGVDDGGQGIIRARDGGELRRSGVGQIGERSPPRLIQSLDPGPDAGRDVLHALQDRGVADDHSGFGVADEIGQFDQRVGRIQRQVDQSGPQAGQIEQQAAGGLFDLHRDPIARDQARGREHVGQPRRSFAQRSIGHRRLAGLLQRNASRLEFGGETEIEQVGHGACLVQTWGCRQLSLYGRGF